MTTKLVWADDEPDQQEEERDNTLGELKEEASQGDSDFPSLAAAAKMPPPAKAAPKKKKKGQTLSLQELLNMPSEGGGRGGPAAGPLKDDRAILLSLPTSSKGKAEGDEERGGLGGAFKEYGGDRGRFGGRDDRRGPRGEGDGEGFQPSRADAVDDWGSTRQFQPSAGRPGGGGFGGGGGGGFRDREPRGDREREPRPFSQADTADDWGSNRKFEPSHDDRDRRGGGGGGGGCGGFRDAPRIDGPPRPRAGPMFDARPARADEEDQWSRGREFQASERPGPRGSSGSREPPSGRQRGFGFAGEGRNPDAEDRWGHRAPPQAQAAAAAPDAPVERPRLKLAPRTVPVEQAPPAAAVTSPTADKPAEKPAEEEPPKRRSNPFGEARPREEVLSEKVSSEPPKSAWGKPVAADAPAAPAPEEPAPAAEAAAEAEPAAAPAAAPAEPAAARAEPAAAPAPTVISLESPAERELKQTIAESQAELDKLQADPDADDEDVAEATTQLAALQAKLADMQEERALLEKKAAEAVAEDDGSGWVSAKPAKKAAPAAAAPAEPARPAATSPTGASGGRGGAWGASGPQAGRGRTGGFSDRDRPSGDRPSGDRPSGGPPRQGGAGDWPRGGARPVAAGAPGQERKW